MIWFIIENSGAIDTEKGCIFYTLLNYCYEVRFYLLLLNIMEQTAKVHVQQSSLYNVKMASYKKEKNPEFTIICSITLLNRTTIRLSRKRQITIELKRPIIIYNLMNILNHWPNVYSTSNLWPWRIIVILIGYLQAKTIKSQV